MHSIYFSVESSAQGDRPNEGPFDLDSPKRALAASAPEAAIVWLAAAGFDENVECSRRLAELMVRLMRIAEFAPFLVEPPAVANERFESLHERMFGRSTVETCR